MIAAAQRGSERSVQELVLRHIGFVSFRLHRKVFPDLLRRFGEELLSKAIPILYAKIQTYDLAEGLTIPLLSGILKKYSLKTLW